METAHELFIHEINDMLDGERQLTEALSELENESSQSELKKAFASHRKQTEEHVRRLEQILDELDESAEDTECKGIRGLIEEKKSISEEDPSPDILDIYNLAAASKVEAYEIRAYHTVIQLATALGLRRGRQLLERTLKEEQQTLNKLETMSRKRKPGKLGLSMEEDKIEGNRRPRKVA